MKSRSVRAIRQRRSLVGLLLALALAAVFGIAAQQAAAYGIYLHGGITTCSTCHLDGHTRWTPVNEVCNSCHPGYRVPSAATMCWTCHTPGQDMSGFRNDAACTAACHLVDGTISTHLAHADRPATCTTCHPLTVSLTDAGGSPHHTRPLPPAPVVAEFAPLSAAVGDLVTLTGTGFSGAYAVGFNGTPAIAFKVISDTQITASVPVGASTGPITVTTIGGSGTSVASLRVIDTVAARVTLRVTTKSIAPGQTVHMVGTVTPASLAGARVHLTVEARRSGAWATVRATRVSATPTGAYTWAYRPSQRGRCRAQATVTETPLNTAARSPWVSFTVR
jgi:hypothetical protein